MPLHKKVILVDDDQDDCLLFEDAMHDIGMVSKLEVANHGEELFQILSSPYKYSPDIIFLDLNMPKMNGYECISKLRNSVELSKIPIVVFTTINQVEMIDWAYFNGADLFVLKPNSYVRLKETIRYVVNIDFHEESFRDNKQHFIYNF
jgi:PleD family two-component response regulator